MVKLLWQERITKELDEDGIIQANSLKKTVNLGLRSDKIYSSPFKRAIQTIKPFAETNPEIIIKDKKKILRKFICQKMKS